MMLKHWYMVVIVGLGMQLSLEAGKLTEIYDNTVEMGPSFVATWTEIDAFEETMLAITGTLDMSCANTMLLTNQTEIDAAQLTVIELLKTILLKLTQ